MKYRKILILEDELIVGLDLQEILIHEGYKTNLVHSYDEGMLELTTYHPQLILCDINLNGKSFYFTIKIDVIKNDDYNIPYMKKGDLLENKIINQQNSNLRSL